MPDAPIATPPAATESSSKGLDSFLSEMMQGVEVPDTKPAAAPPEPAPEKPAAKAEPAPPTKPAPKPPEAKVAPKPEPKPTDTKPAPQDNVAQLRQRKDALEKYEKQAKAEIAKLQEENRTLAGKKYVTPEIEQEIADNKAEVARLKAQVAESAFEHSDEFKSRYVEPWQRTLQSVLAMVDQMATPDQTEEGGPQSRKTTSADLQRVMAAPVSEQAEMAQKIFGQHNALRVLTQIDKLNDMKQQAEASIKSHHAEMGAKQKQMEEWQRTEIQKYTTLRDQNRKELVEKYPQFFGPDEADPEASEALTKGFEFVDRAAEKAEDLSVDERAAYSEVIRAKAAWFPKGHLLIKRKDEKIAALEEELSKYRGSDPGSEKEKGRTEPKKENEMGIGLDGMAAAFDKL